MRVKTKQSYGLADSLVAMPVSELDVLTEMIEWSNVEALLSSIKSDYDAVSLFKLLLLQNWHNLSDAGMSDAVGRDIVFMRFCDFSIAGKKPDAATICRFRNKLVEQGLLDSLLGLINESLDQQGLKLANGKYVSADATLIQSARRPRKSLCSKQDKDGVYEADEVIYSDDSDAGWIKKNGEYTYGYSATVMTDENGMVLNVNTHSANTSEMTRFKEDIQAAKLKRGQKILYDKGVTSQANREFLKAEGLRDGVMRKKPKGRAMSHWEGLRNRLISSKRFVTERTFGTLKRVYGLHRSRYLGLAKVNSEVLLKSIAYNLKRAINLYLKRQPNCV